MIVSPTVSRKLIRSENVDVTAQNLCTKSRAGSIPLCKFLIHCNQQYLKPTDTIRLCFENVNGLPSSKNRYKYDKVKKKMLMVEIRD